MLQAVADVRAPGGEVVLETTARACPRTPRQSRFTSPVMFARDDSSTGAPRRPRGDWAARLVPDELAGVEELERSTVTRGSPHRYERLVDSGSLRSRRSRLPAMSPIEPLCDATDLALREGWLALQRSGTMG